MRLRVGFICKLILVVFTVGCNGQQQNNNFSKASAVVGGPFENGELMYIDMPQNIPSIDTSAGWAQSGQKILITGTIYHSDGTTPAQNVILYYYHTDVNGYYSNKEGLNQKAKAHGYIRGWVKSDVNGKYSIYTVKPASYPNTNFEAHIHPAIKEPDIDNPYYIDDFVFDDDTLLTGEKRKKLENRGGSGILRFVTKDHLQIAEHDIILGLNIPNYPQHKLSHKNYGLHIGEDQPSFIPFHAYGPDKGSRACPVCKYGRYYGLLYFVGNNPDWNEIKKWLLFLEQLCEKKKKYFKAYFVYGSNQEYEFSKRKKELEQLGTELNIKQVALTFVPSFDDIESEANLNKLHSDSSSTIVIYKYRKIIDVMHGIKPTIDYFNKIEEKLNNNNNPYFYTGKTEQHF